MLSGILRYMHSVDPVCPNFLDKKDHHFKELHAAVDNLGRQLRSTGIGAEVKHASMITADEEEALSFCHSLYQCISIEYYNCCLLTAKCGF